jgi:transposase, IS30 family
MRLEDRKKQHLFWTQIRAGLACSAAAAAAGVRRHTAAYWFLQAGGIMPPNVPAQPRQRSLSLEEREDIHAGIEREESIRAIARRLSRAPSTVFRELRRNMRDQSYRTRSTLRQRRPGRRRTQPWEYRPSLAQERAERRAARPKVAKLAVNSELGELVQFKLKERLSPEQISAELREEFPDRPEMWVSHEAIYQSIYVQGRGALRRELAICLRTGRALRKPRRKVAERRGRIPNMVMISERPPEVEDRAIPGHWEGDLLTGKNKKSAIGTLVERSSRYVILLHLPNGHGAEGVEKAITAAVQELPQTLRRSLTWDQGHEMANHRQLKIATGLEVYFCDPHSPWQRGSNENTNGLLRQYFPKGQDLSRYGPDYLAFVSAQMNRRPRKTLGWLRPSQALERLLSDASQSANVASTD